MRERFLDILSRISPLSYAVDLTRNAFYSGASEYGVVTLEEGAVENLLIIGVIFAVFMVTGMYLFVRNETNR